jgi:hypothetical protein
MNECVCSDINVRCEQLRIIVNKTIIYVGKETSQKSLYSQGGIAERPSAKEIGRGFLTFCVDATVTVSKD